MYVYEFNLQNKARLIEDIVSQMYLIIRLILNIIINIIIPKIIGNL